MAEMFSPSYVKSLVSTIHLMTSVPGGSWCLATLKPVIEWGIAKYCGDNSNASLIISKCDKDIILENLPSLAAMLNKLDEKDWAVVDSLSSYAYEKNYITVQHLVDLIEVLYKIKDDLREHSLQFLKIVLDGAVVNDYAINIIDVCDDNITRSVCPKLLDALAKLEKSELSSLMSMPMKPDSVFVVNKILPDMKCAYSENRESVKMLLKAVFGVGDYETDPFLVCGETDAMEVQAFSRMQREFRKDYPHFFELVKDGVLNQEITEVDFSVMMAFH